MNTAMMKAAESRLAGVIVAPSQSWEMTYASDRRKHLHRCRVCSRLAQPGQRVVMLRQNKGSRVIHAEPCAGLEHSPGSGITWREAFELWGVQRNARLGYPEAQKIVDTHPFFQSRPMASEAFQ